MSILNEPGLVDAGGNSFTGADAVGVDRLIEASYPDAWRRVAKVAPRTWLGNKSFKSQIGVIATFTLTDQAASGNTGFAVNDLVYILSQTGQKAYFKVDTVNVATEVTAISLVSSGSGFLVSNYDATVYSGAGDIVGDMFIHIDTISTVLNNPVSSLTEGIGYVVLPDDFYLLTKFKMTGWKVATMEAALANTRVANIQSNEHTRGSQIRPATVINNKEVDGAIKQVLEYYSLQKGLASHTVEEALYVPIVESIEDKADTYELGINDQIIIPLAYLSAATVFTILEKPTIAAALEARADALLPGLLSVRGTNVTVKQ